MNNLITKNDVEFFQLVKKGYEGNKEAKRQAAVLIEAFMAEPVRMVQKKIQAMEKAIQAVGVSTDFAQLTKDAFNVTIQNQNFDMGWERSYDQQPLGEGQDSWEIYDVSNSLTFRKVEEGQRIQVDEFTGTLVTAYVDYYGGALGWTDKMIRFRKVPAMINKAKVFRNKFFTNKATNHYLLLATAAALNLLAAQGAAADGRVQRNVKTINRGAFNIGNRIKDKGYDGDPANTEMILYANPLDRDRIEAAFRITSNALASAPTGAGATGRRASEITPRRITRIYTYNSNIVTGFPILVLPGNKIQKADAMQPTTFIQPKDALTLNELQAVWAIYGAIVGDSDQCEQITLV